MIIWLLCNGKRYAYYRLPANEVFYSSHVDRRGRLCGKVQTITLKWPGKDSDIEKDKKFFLPAEIRVKIWLGLAIHEQDWLSQQKGADLAIYAETYENHSNVLGQWTSSGPLMSRPPWADVTGAVRSCEYRHPHLTLTPYRSVYRKRTFNCLLAGDGKVIGTSVPSSGDFDAIYHLTDCDIDLSFQFSIRRRRGPQEIYRRSV